MTSVIIFGPTGQIGCVAARTAGELGAKVWLAMRDTSKAIPGLSENAEKSGSFQRVRADLSEPESLSQAVKTSGAKRAFIYLHHGSRDGMKGIFEALKSAGIEFVVFLSSFTIPIDKDKRDIPQAEVLPYIHAQAEASLDDIFGEDHYVAMRPGAFITNLLQYKEGINAGEVSLYGGVFEQDNVVPTDMGRVAANVLVNGPKNGQKKVYVYGPDARSITESVVKIGQLLGKDVKVTNQTREEAYENYIKAGLPDFFAKYMCEVLSTRGPEKGDGIFPHYEEGVKNVELYTGRPSTTFEQWVADNRAKLTA